MSDYEAALRLAADHALEWVDRADERPVGATVTVDQLRTRLARALPEDPCDADAVIADLVADTEGGLLGNTGGRFFAWVIGGTHPAALAADWLTSSWDQNAALADCSPALAVIEEVAGAWTLEILGLPQDASFGFTSGCQLAHVTALAAARRKLLLDAGWNPEERGMSGAPPLHVVSGEQGHETIDRAVRLLGIGSDHLHTVAAPGNRTDPRQLKQLLGGLGADPAVVCLSAGDINCGQFDDFGRIIALCRERGNTWVHVDGAFGLWARTSTRFAHLLNGVEDADSWATDGHKWLNTPFDVGFVAIRDREAHRGAFSTSAPYLTQESGARDQLDWSPEWSRRGRSVPVYAALRGLGRSGVASLVDRCCDAAAGLVEGIGALPGAEILAPALINQGLVRFLDPHGGDHDAFTDHAIALLQAEGTAFFGGTSHAGVRAMRISVCSWRTTEEDVDRTVDAVRSVLDEAARG